jgi:iron complex transport system ATP-binding protein
VGLLGPNGSGKSSLIRAILGLIGKSSGKIVMNGIDVSKENRKKRALLFAYMPQNTAMPSSYTVLECVVMGRYPRLAAFRQYTKQDYEIALSTIERTGLSGFENRTVSTLSGGEAARTMLARALAQDTPSLFLDEPMSSLDPGHASAIAHITRALADSGKLVIVSMHDVNMALHHADRLILLKQGRVYGRIQSSDIEENTLAGLYGIPWEIWRSPGGRLVALPQR